MFGRLAPMRRNLSVVITDLDNTLYDWVDIWYKSFRAMLDRLVFDSGVSEDVLLPEFKAIHERHRTSEYAFSIEELPSLLKRYPGENLLVKFEGAIQAFRVARKAALRLYPGVAETLAALRNRGCLVIGYTESMEFYTNYRVRNLHLDGLLDYLYSPPDHELPRHMERLYAKEHYDLKGTIHKILARGAVKPNPEILGDIVTELGAEIDECVYVGDSLMKDVYMAQQAGIADVWAKYGVANSREEYELLRAVTHWTKEEVEAERKLMPEHLNPTYVLHDNLAELLELFRFCSFSERGHRMPAKTQVK